MPKQFKAIKLPVLIEGQKGGGGSGNYGHRGRPGHLGGSVGGSGTGGGAGLPLNSQLGLEAAKKYVGKKVTYSTDGIDKIEGTAIGVQDDQLLIQPVSKGAPVYRMPVGLVHKYVSTSVYNTAPPKPTVSKFEQTMANQIAEEAAAARLKAKLDATQNFTGKPKPMTAGKPDVSQQLADKVKLAGQLMGEAKASGGSKAHATAVSAIMGAIEQAKAEGMDNTVALLRKNLAKQQKFVDYWKKVEASHVKK